MNGGLQVVAGDVVLGDRDTGLFFLTAHDIELVIGAVRRSGCRVCGSGEGRRLEGGDESTLSSVSKRGRRERG